ncbi:Integrator complex subunit 2 [Fasciola hepatica]|uniref:Integrator complex subunit 2 n=1 Tax=Fasciola hepatica TaxID=6192 RepID=A0A4E0S0Q4_FASHE|nr:Integrator complex subunit 2 [Fasciola hepatica]
MSLFLLLKRLLLDSGPETRSWICDYLKHKSDHLRKLDHHLIETTKSFVPNDTSVPLSDDVILKALTLLRVLTALRGFVNYTFSPELSSRLLELLTHRTCVSERGSQYITYALAFLIGLRSSLSHSQDIANRSDFPADTERIIVTWLQRLIDQQDSFQSISLSSSVTDLPDPLNTSVSVSKPYVESLLLLAILFHTNQPGPITELISNLLGLRIPSLGRTVNGWRKVFLNSVFTETMIANQAARIPITRGLNRRLGSHLPIQCVLQLLKSHAFAKNKLHIKEWIVGQLCESVRPLHPLLPDLIEAHVIHAFGATPNTLPPADSSFHSPGLLTALISESDLIAQFGRTDQLAIARMCVPTPADGDLAKHGDFDYPPQARAPSSAQIDLTPALLFLYYVLFVYDYQLTLRISTNRPVLLCHLVELNQRAPSLRQPLHFAKGLVTNHLPHLTVGELIIQDELLLDPMWSAETDSNEAETLALFDSNGSVPTVCSPEQLDAAFLAVHAHLDDTTVRAQSRWSVLDSDAHRAVRHLVSSVHNLACLVRALHVDRLVPYGAVLGQRVPSLLLHTANTIFSGNQRFIRLLEYLWRRLHMVMPRRLGVLTINSLIESRYGGSPAQVSADIFSGGLRRQKALTNEDLYIDPVENVMNSVDSRVFRYVSFRTLPLFSLRCSMKGRFI